MPMPKETPTSAKECSPTLQANSSFYSNTLKYIYPHSPVPPPPTPDAPTTVPPRTAMYHTKTEYASHSPHHPHLHATTKPPLSNTNHESITHPEYSAAETRSLNATQPRRPHHPHLSATSTPAPSHHPYKKSLSIPAADLSVLSYPAANP